MLSADIHTGGPDNRQYLDEKLRRHDHDFVLLQPFIARPVADVIAAIFALHAELRSITLEVHEADVAMAKLGWWQEEWNRLKAGEARHPVTQSLVRGLVEGLAQGRDQSMETPALAVELTPALGAVAALVQQSVLEDRDQLQDWIDRRAAPLAALEAAVCNLPVEQAQVGWRGLVQSQLLEDWLSLAQLDRAPMPLSLQARLQLTPRTATEPETLARLLPELAPPQQEGFGQGFAAACYQIKAHDHRLLQRKPARFVAGARVSQLRRLMTAWSAARQANSAALAGYAST